MSATKNSKKTGREFTEMVRIDILFFVLNVREVPDAGHCLLQLQFNVG